MISGQLAPSSANFVQQSNYFIEDDITTTSDGLYKTEKIDTTFFSNTTSSSSGFNNPDETKSKTTTFNTTSTTGTTISIPGFFNISTNNSNATTVAATAASTTTTTIATTNATNNTSQCHQQETNLCNTTNSTTTETTTAATANCNCYNAATIAAANAITDARGRSAALERAYVHDVYENCEEPTSGPIRPRVAQFLANLEPGSIVCDVGCGNGRYLTSCNPLICTIGADRCYRLTKVAREKGGEVALCDNLELPFRDESFDAVLSLAVVHHFATTERRVGAIRELARILRIGGRVIISVWALEQRHRRFESQDVLIPWQPSKNRNYNLSDDEDDDDYLPPYHAYTEDSTNSSRSAGDGDSSSLSSSSPGESCYSFVRRAIQKLAGGRKHPWFLDSWNSKDTKNDSSLEYEDAKDLPIELRRLEDFEDLPDPPLSAGLKSRSLGSILNPPPIVQIVRSRSSVPSLGAQMPEHKQQQIQHLPPALGSTTSLEILSSRYQHQLQQQQESLGSGELGGTISTSISPTKQTITSTTSVAGVSSCGGRRPKLVKQKQSLCDEEYQLPDNHIHTMSNDSSYVSNYSNCCSTNKVSGINQSSDTKSSIESRTFLRKQSSLNEELMAENRLREKERIRKRIQKQMSLNETFLCRSLFTKRLQVIREGFTTKLKTSTGSLERVTKNGFVKIMQNFKASQFSTGTATTTQHSSTSSTNTTSNSYHKNNGNHNTRLSSGSSSNDCNCGITIAGGGTNNCNHSSCDNSCSCNNQNINGNEDQQKLRRHSRESGSDSSKDSSLQSDTSIESEDSFASVIFIPKPEQQQIQSNQVQQHNSNNSNSICNKNSNNNGNCNNSTNSISCKNSTSYKIPSVPTSPLIMPCPPTPAHSPAAVTSSLASSEYNFIHTYPKLSPNSNSLQGNNNTDNNNTSKNRFTFDEEHIIQQQKQQQQPQQQPIKTSPVLNQKKTAASQGLQSQQQQQQQQQQQPKLPKITRQTIQNLPQIPKFRKQQSLQMTKTNFPIVRRASAAPAVPKLLSLEIFNPETDDLDSDSSEPSSPDSIDSVISALKPDTDEAKHPQKQHQKSDLPQQRFSLDSSILSSESGSNPITSTGSEPRHVSTNPFIDTADTAQILKDDDIERPLILNKEIDDSSTNLIYNAAKRNQEQQQQQSFVDFAEQLSAQLLKKLEENENLESLSKTDDSNTANVDGIFSVNSSCKNSRRESISNGNKKSNGEIGDLNSLKEELRERRLMLANLSTHHHHQQQQPSPTSTSSSTTSSQTRSCSIYDDASNELRYSPSLFDSKASKRRFLRNFNENRQYSSGSVPDTAYLIPDNGGDSSFDDDDALYDNDIADIDEVDHDVIIEENEDIDEDDYNSPTINKNNRYDEERSTKNTIKYLDNDEIITTTKIVSNQSKDDDDDGGDDYDENDNNSDEKKLETIQSTESWGHSNSTNSLDSPSQGGGSTTHHRYYHVFREGELDALINHHVASLHIVSSYYERASWCVVAEKVQVWTI